MKIAQQPLSCSVLKTWLQKGSTHTTREKLQWVFAWNSIEGLHGLLASMIPNQKSPIDTYILALAMMKFMDLTLNEVWTVSSQFCYLSIDAADMVLVLCVLCCSQPLQWIHQSCLSLIESASFATTKLSLCKKSSNFMVHSNDLHKVS